MMQQIFSHFRLPKNENAMKNILILAVLCLLSSCVRSVAPDEFEGDGPIYLQVENISKKNFDNVRVITPGGDHEFGPLKKGEASVYKSYTLAYRYGYVEAVIGDDTLIVQPIDYVGETPLEDGQHTYALDVYGNRDSKSLNLTLR